MIRTDLAIEACKNLTCGEGICVSEEEIGGVKITHTQIKTDAAARRIGRATGEYITLEMGAIAEKVETDGAARILARQLRRLLGNAKEALVIGLGNTDITPDALGPKTAQLVLATRHLTGEMKKSMGLFSLRSVSVLSPGVLGQTGIETAEIIRAVCDATHPQAVIAVDALAAAGIERLGSTVQLSNAGISPGSGVGNARSELSKTTLGVPVIALGIPTVTDSATFGGVGGFIVTPRDIDMLILRASELLAAAINLSLQPDTDEELLLSLV